MSSGPLHPTRRFGERRHHSPRQWKTHFLLCTVSSGDVVHELKPDSVTVPPIYTASHDVQGRWREVHFGDRARGAKTSPSEDGGGERGLTKNPFSISKIKPPPIESSTTP